MPIPCWLITLDPEKKAVAELCQQLEQLGIPTHIVQAVDGRKGYPALENDEQLNQKAARHFRGAELSGAEIGCYLSHYRLIKQLYAQGHEKACIIEDDIGLDPGFSEALTALARLGPEYEHVRLMGLRIRKRKIIQTLHPGLSLVRPLKGLVGTQGYMINRQGMAKVIAHGNIIYKPIDKLYDYFWEYDLRSYATEPHVIHEIEHPTSIPKPAQKTKQLSKTSHLFWQLHKLRSSLSRLCYIALHISEFLPAELPRRTPGKTKKLR